VSLIFKVFSMNISKQLEAYEVEYHVLQEEMNSLRAASDRKGSSDLGGPSPESTDSGGTPDRLVRLQVANDALRRQKIELLEQLQVLIPLISGRGLLAMYQRLVRDKKERRCSS
jgi:hypothetical protein